jgi:hypothetical protein
VGSLVSLTDWSTLFVGREAFDGVDDGADLAQVFGAPVALGEVLVQAASPLGWERLIEVAVTRWTSSRHTTSFGTGGYSPAGTSATSTSTRSAASAGVDFCRPDRTSRTASTAVTLVSSHPAQPMPCSGEPADEQGERQEQDPGERPDAGAMRDGTWSDLRVRRFFCREVSLGQEGRHQLVEVVWALQRHQV